MMRRYVTGWSLLILLTLLISQVAHARKLKVYALPKGVVPGQLAIIVFQNPEPEHPRTQSKCSAEKMIAWMKSDIPILRIEQGSKQVWTSLGSYQSVGDSCIATFMAPLIMEPGPATMFLVNGTDPSVPYPFTIGKAPEAKLVGVGEGSIKPLAKFHLLGDGFVPEGSVDEKKAREELEGNIGLSKLPPGDQWTAVNHRLIKDWDKLPGGNFLYLEQGGKTWRCFVEECGVTMTQGMPAMSLQFTAPPDIAPGPVSLTLGIRMKSVEVAKSNAITVQATP